MPHRMADYVYPDEDLTVEDLQDLHEDILDRNEDGVKSILSDFRGHDALIRKLCCTEVSLEPAAHDHVLNRLPLSALHRAALIESHGIQDAILTSADGVDVDLPLQTSRLTPLHVASSGGVLASVNYLTSSGASLVARDADGRTPLHVAAADGHKDVVSLLSVRGAPINALDDRRQTALHVAAGRGHHDVVDFLLSKSADVNAADVDGRTPLHEAQVSDSVDVTRALLAKGADVNIVDRNGNSAIHMWIINKEKHKKGLKEERRPFESLSVLMTFKADVNLQNQRGDPALHVAARVGDCALTEFLLNKGADFRLLNNAGRSALFLAGSVDVMDLLLRCGSDVTLLDCARNNLLHAYASSDDVTVAMVKAAIGEGVEINAQNSAGWTPLHCACAAGSRVKAEALLEAGARNDLLDGDGQSVLHVSMRSCEEPLAMWLLKKNSINLNQQDSDGNTLLHLAATSGNISVVEFLTSQNVDVSMENGAKQTAATLAARNEHLDCLRRILLRGGSIDPEIGAAILLSYVRLGDADVVGVLLDQVDCNGKADDRGRTALHIAVERRLADIADILLDHGADIHVLDADRQSPLHVACRRLPELEPLLPRLIDPELCNGVDSAGNTPLHVGIASCSADTLRLFLGSGCQLSREDRDGRTTAHRMLEGLLSSADQTPEVETLAKLDVMLTSSPQCVRRSDRRHESLLHLAVRSKKPPLVELLLRHSPEVNATNDSKLTPLHYASQLGRTKMAALLLDSGADPDVTDVDGRSPIFYGVLCENIELVRMLLRRGSDVNLRDSAGKTCLMVAMEMGLSELCQAVLLDATPDVCLRDNRGRTLLHFAAGHCSKSVVECLVDMGADLNAEDSGSCSPIQEAAGNGDDGVMAVLLSSGAQINAQDEAGNTALHLCSERGSYNHVKLLLDHGADPEIRNALGRTATHLAATASDADVLELLIANEANIDVTDLNGNTPLVMSILAGSVENSTDLLDQDADVTITNDADDTALHHAMRMPSLDRKLLKLLVRRGRDCLRVVNGDGQTPEDILASRTDIDPETFAQDVGLEL